MAFGRKELLKKLVGKTVLLTSRCGTFKETPGQVKDVFDDFFMFLTEDVGTGRYSIRNFVMDENLGVIIQQSDVASDTMDVVR